MTAVVMKTERVARIASVVVAATVVGVASVACGVVAPGPAFDPAQCAVGRLDEAADPAALFPAIPCAIVIWDTEMDGAGMGADGSISTPPGLVAAAASRGYASPCETTISPDPASPAQPWFVSRFGELNPTAALWSATLFVPVPIPDGTNPACVAVTPPGP